MVAVTLCYLTYSPGDKYSGHGAHPVDPVKTFSCGDVVPGCGARFWADSAEEIEALVGVHASWAHGLTGLHLPADVAARIRAAIGPATDD